VRHRRRWVIALKALAGLLAGMALWLVLAGPYNEMLAGMAEPLVRALERSPATRLHAWNGNIIIERPEFRPGSPTPALDAGRLTANIILLTALFATNRRPMSVRNLAAFVFAALILIVVHVLAVVVNVQSIYAWDLGAWSAAHYGRLARTFWEGATHFYTVAGSFGSAFLLWWLSGTLSGNAALPDDPPQRRSGSGQR
jgi:hypothetical protein